MRLDEYLQNDNKQPLVYYDFSQLSDQQLHRFIELLDKLPGSVSFDFSELSDEELEEIAKGPCRSIENGLSPHLNYKDQKEVKQLCDLMSI